MDGLKTEIPSKYKGELICGVYDIGGSNYIALSFDSAEDFKEYDDRCEFELITVARDVDNRFLNYVHGITSDMKNEFSVNGLIDLISEALKSRSVVE